MSKFIKRSDGIWDAPECCECCSDCSSCEQDCTCPLDIEEVCDNCIFKNGYKKCKECCTKPRTTNEYYCQIGYWYMCDDCISKTNLVNKEGNDNMKMRIKRMRENAKLPKIHNGNWADCYVSQIGCVDINALETGKEFTFDDIIWYPNGLTYAKEDVIVVKLGFALELPKGKEAYLLPRSGTFRKTGLLLTNSMGIIDDTYIGDNDEYLGMFYATREGHVNIGDRLLQMKIEDSMPEIEFEEVESFGNKDRGGYGSTGV